MLKRIKYKIMSWYCWWVCHKFQSNHVGVIKCVRCNRPWNIEGRNYD